MNESTRACLEMQLHQANDNVLIRQRIADEAAAALQEAIGQREVIEAQLAGRLELAIELRDDGQYYYRRPIAAERADRDPSLSGQTHQYPPRPRIATRSANA